MIVIIIINPLDSEEIDRNFIENTKCYSSHLLLSSATGVMEPTYTNETLKPGLQHDSYWVNILSLLSC